MANCLILRDRRKDPWGKVTARIFWGGGGQSKVWVGESGSGDFDGSGVVSHVVVAGEEITVGQKVDGNTVILAVSKNSH